MGLNIALGLEVLVKLVGEISLDVDPYLSDLGLDGFEISLCDKSSFGSWALNFCGMARFEIPVFIFIGDKKDKFKLNL